MRIAINGLGRIGRLALRRLVAESTVEIVACNDLAPIDNIAYLLAWDTAQGQPNFSVEHKENALVIDGLAIPFYSERDASSLPWAELSVDVVIDCTGVYLSREKAEMHLEAGAGKVVLSAPPKSPDIPTVVLGVNDDVLKPEDRIVSNASCTTNCLAPMVRVLDELAGIESGFITTVHSFTSSQAIQDGPSKKDMRRGRAASYNIIPTTTGATKALGLVYPSLDGKIKGMAARVPVITGSFTDLVAVVKEQVSAETINGAFEKAAANQLHGILQYTTQPVVSSDIIGNKHSCIVDGLLTEVQERMVKIIGWYDNEAGYANRLAELALKVG